MESYVDDIMKGIRETSKRISEDMSHNPDKIIRMSDEEILDKIAGAEHPSIIARYQLVMMLRLRGEISELNNRIKEFSKASNFSSWVMIILTAVIAVLTTVLIFK